MAGRQQSQHSAHRLFTHTPLLYTPAHTSDGGAHTPTHTHTHTQTHTLAHTHPLQASTVDVHSPLVDLGLVQEGLWLVELEQDVWGGDGLADRQDAGVALGQ